MARARRERGRKHLRGEMGFDIDGVRGNAIYFRGAMTKIFISYRRQDSKHIAGRIYDRLEAKFGREAVFMDIDNIPFGVDFHDYLSEAVGRAEIVLVLIGHGWADARDEAGQRRLDNPDDFVRVEIEAAVQRKIWLGPVLIDGVPPPRPEHLPEGMRELTRRNATFVNAGRDFHMHLDRLIGDLERILNIAPRVRYTQVDRRGRDGRVGIEAAIVNNSQGQWFLPGAGQTEWFQDVGYGPEMVVVPAGTFSMGSPEIELEREPWLRGAESPQHNVVIAKPFAVARFATTRGEFRAFVNNTDYRTERVESLWNRNTWKFDSLRSWRHPGFAQDDGHPVMCVSWHDAQAYIKWLNQNTGQTYRLPSEAEWEFACRAGTDTPFWWGSSIMPDQANYNCASDAYQGGGRNGVWRQKTVPVDSFAANPWGLYQVHGNAWEWTDDCWNGNYHGAPTDGSVWATGHNNRRVLRGASWFDEPGALRAACRTWSGPGSRARNFGFRLVRTLEPQPQADGWGMWRP